MTPQFRRSRWNAVGIALLVCSAPGCVAIDMSDTVFSKHSRQYQGIDSSYDNGMSSMSEPVYHSVRRARAENSVVLQVVGDETPARVLPLPANEQTVYVSELLTQTGVIQKLDHVEATLFRYSTDSIGGIPMEVKMDSEGKTVRPESDYMLQAGDRLKVSEAPPAMEVLVKAALGL